MCKMMEDSRNEAISKSGQRNDCKKASKNRSPERIHEDDEYPMELILKVQKELLVHAQ